MKKILIILAKVSAGLAFTWLVWDMTRGEWLPYFVPASQTTGVGSHFREPVPDMTVVAVLGGILACWITSSLNKWHRLAGIGVAAGVLASPFVLPPLVKIFLFVMHSPSLLPQFTGMIFDMQLTVLSAAAFVVLGWSMGWTGARFWDWAMQDPTDVMIEHQ